MKAEVMRTFTLSGKEFRKGDVIDIPVSVFHKLSLKGLVRPYNPDVSEEELPYLRAKFDEAFSEHLNRLKHIKIPVSKIKEMYPELYKKFRALEEKMDEAWLTFDYEAFLDALKEIEEMIKDCLIYEEVEDKPQERELIQKELERVCINCGGNLWLILKPQSRTSAIRCVNCNHMESYIKGNSEKQV
ncbi:MAG: hypothetical protein ABIM20_07850 [candidate division WOR-3 bacterium]